MKLRDMTDQDLYNMVRITILEENRTIPPHIAREVNRRKKVDPNAFDFLNSPPEPKKPSVRLTLTNRECNILMGELYSIIQTMKNWLHDHPGHESKAAIEARMNEKVVIAEKINARMGE